MISVSTDWLSAVLMVKMYLCFNFFVMLLQLLDSVLHILVLYKLFYSSTFISCAALLFSFIFSQIFKTICFNATSNDTVSDLNLLLAPFGNILYLFKYKKHLSSILEYTRIYQLYLEYNRLLSVYYYNNKIIQINNISLFAKCYINHYGNSLFDCFLHEIFESFPYLIILFLTVIYYQEYNIFIYNLSIIISLFCIICQIFVFVSSKYHMHRSILFIIYTLIVINVLMLLSLVSFLTCITCIDSNSYNININQIYYLKYKYLTLPFSTSMCILYILRKISISYHNNRPTQSFKQFVFCIIYLLLSIAIYFILFILSSIVFDIFLLPPIWFAFIIDRIYNQRFYNNRDENNRFWRLIIQFIVVTDKAEADEAISYEKIFKKLFAVNSILSSKQQYFPNRKLSQWMNKEYVNIYYKHFNFNFNKFENNNFKHLKRIKIFKMVFIDEFFISYFSNRDTLNNIRQFFYDFVNSINICNVIHDNHINLFAQIIYFCVYYFTIYIGVTTYILSRILTLIFPILYFLNSKYDDFSLLPIIITYLYFFFIFLFLMIYFKSLYIKITKIIWYLAPGYYYKNEMYLRKIQNYHKTYDLQQYVYQCIVWYYNSHKNAPLIATFLIQKFGIDITSVVVMYLPSSYCQEIQIES